MQAMVLFFTYALVAVFLENTLFTRLFGVGQLVFYGDWRSLLMHGSSITVITALSSMLCYGVNILLYDEKPTLTQRSFWYLLAVSVVYVVVYLVLNYFLHGRLREMRQILPLAAFNCAVLGTMILSVRIQHSFAATVGFSVGTGVGYMAAIFLILTGRRRLELLELPRAFRGMPILLLYIGIVSLAIYGLIGHQLPT